MFTEENLLERGGTVLNQLPNANTESFPSDHFPVVYDDEVVGLRDANITVQVFNPNLESPVGDPVILDIDRTTRLSDITANDPVDDDLNIIDTDIEFFTEQEGRNRLRFTIVEDGNFPDADFNGYALEFENLPRPINEARLSRLGNSLGLDSSNVTFDSDTVFIDLGGLDPNPGLGFDIFLDVGSGS